MHETNSVNEEVGIYYGRKYNVTRKMGSSQDFSVLDSVTSVGLTEKVKFEKRIKDFERVGHTDV